MGEQANDLTGSFESGIDLRGREDEIVQDAQDLIDFQPDDDGLLNQTHWWGLDAVPAFQWAGTVNGKEAILKVQGVQPETSEITALERFAQAAAGSRMVRPPEVLGAYPWDNAKQFELIAIERIRSEKLIGYPATEQTIDTFGAIFDDYRQVASRIEPWITAPSTPFMTRYTEQVAKQRDIAKTQFADNPHHHAGDDALIDAGLQKLTSLYRNTELTFQHVHISTDDVFLPNGDDGRYLYTSNFVWDWQPPFHDAGVAHFHYPRLLADRYDQATPSLIKEQTALWQAFMDSLPQTDEERQQMHAAQLQNTISNLSLSVFTMEHPDSDAARTVVETTRQRLEGLLV